ncbi:MAG TPA: NB-ARC domain-containing protein [Kofleriaceae bacterium]|nr:NB-ARC domain-containing protein [Kofleriaceae bacterium]
MGIFGLSGSGKTTLAASAARHCAGTLTTIWISVGEQEVGFLLETLAVALGESLAGIAGLANQANYLRAATDTGARLFVFDDVSQESTADVLLRSVATGNAVILTGLDAGMPAVTRYQLARIASTPLSPDQSRLVAMRLLQDERATEHRPERKQIAVEAVARLAAGQPAVIEILAGELNATGLEAASDLEATIGGIAGRSISENLRMLGVRTLGMVGEEAGRIVRALHVFASNRVIIASLAEVAQCNVNVGLRDLQRRLIVDRDGDVLTFHDYVRRLSREECDDDEHLRLVRAHALHQMTLAGRYGGYEWNFRGYASLVPHENELISLFWQALARWDDRADGSAVGDVLRLAFALSWYLHWRGYSETRFRMCDEIIRRSARLHDVGHALSPSWRNTIGNLHVDQGWVLLDRGEPDAGRRLAVEAQAWINKGDRMYADELEAQAALLQGDHGYAVERFGVLAQQVPERTRPWHLFTMRLGDAQLAAGQMDAHERLMARLLLATEQPRLASGEVIEDVRARILMRCAARDFAGDAPHLGIERLTRAVELFDATGIVIPDRVRAMIELARRTESSERGAALLGDALRHARTLGGRSLISEVEQLMSARPAPAPG